MDEPPHWKSDEDDDWARSRRAMRPDQIPPASSGWKPSIVEWMYVIFGALILWQILRFYLD